MAKRFLDNGIFKNPSFKELPPKLKLFYIYLICECDHCGIYTVELDVASVRIGEQITVSDAQNYLGNKIVPIDNGKRWFLPQFIFFQYGNLNATEAMYCGLVSGFTIIFTGTVSPALNLVTGAVR